MKGRWGDLIAWRTDLTPSQCTQHEFNLIGGPFGVGKLVRAKVHQEPILTIPPRVISSIDTITLEGLAGYWQKQARQRRRTHRDRILAKLRRRIHPGLDAFLRRADAYIRARSPDQVVGWDQPDDWTPGERDAAEWWVPKATAALTALPAIWQNPERFTLDEHVRWAAGALAALRYSIEAGAASTLAAHEDRLDWITVRPGYTESPGARETLQTAGLDPKEHFALPFGDGAPAMRLDDWLHVATPQLTESIRRFVQRLDAGPSALLLSNLYHHIAEEALGSLNEGEPAVRYEWDAHTRVLENLAHWNLWPHPETHPAQLAAFLERAAQVAVLTERGYIPADELRALLGSVGARAVSGALVSA